MNDDDNLNDQEERFLDAINLMTSEEKDAMLKLMNMSVEKQIDLRKMTMEEIGVLLDQLKRIH